MLINLIFFALLVFIMYLLTLKIKDKHLINKLNRYLQVKNEKYYEDLVRHFEKNKKIKLKQRMNFYHRLNVLIDRCDGKRSILINPVSITIMGIICVYISYSLAFNFFKMILLSCVISFPFFYLPIGILTIIAERNEGRIEKVFLNFLLQLKNHTQINNDIVVAMKEVKTVNPLDGYIRKFLIEISSGIKFEKAIENWKERMKIKQIQMFLSNLEHCYLYGGNFSELIDKSYKMIREIQIEKSRRQEETRGARIVLYILIFLDLVVYVSYIHSNIENYRIMQRSLVGNMILYWNFISMWLMVLLSIKVKKLDY